ncbi:MAG: hypothetical protein WB952_26085 [Terriglobales bacterium]
MKKQVTAILVLILSAASWVWAQDAPQSTGQPANVAGSWQMTWQGRSGNMQATLQIQQDGSRLSGSFDGPRGSSSLTGSVQGNQVSFNVVVKARRTFTLVYTGALDGDKMSGTVQPQGRGARGGEGGQRSRTWTATRQQNNPGSQSRPAQSQDTGDEDGL